jgi:hypothetical protein
LIGFVELAGVVVRDALAELRIPVVRANAQHGLDARVGTSWCGSVLVRDAAAKKGIPSIAEYAQDVVDAAPVGGQLVARGDSRGRCASRRRVRCAAGQESEAEEGVSRPLFGKNGCAHGPSEMHGAHQPEGASLELAPPSNTRLRQESVERTETPPPTTPPLRKTTPKIGEAQ